MKNIKYILTTIVFLSIASFSFGEVIYGTVSGAEASGKAASDESANEVLKGVMKENNLIWITPLKVTTETTKSGKQVTTIVYKGANKVRSKLSIEEQVRIQMETEEKLGVPIENRTVMGGKNTGVVPTLGPLFKHLSKWNIAEFI